MPQGKENIKFKGLKESLAAELQNYESLYFREDKPIPFLGLSIYPATMRDYEIFTTCTTCLTLNKNDDPQGVLMTNLEYLVAKTMEQTDEGKQWSYKLQKLIEIIFHIKNGIKCKQCGNIISYDGEYFANYLRAATAALAKEEEYGPLTCPSCGSHEYIDMIKIGTDEKTKKPVLIVDGVVINWKDFDRLRQIVLYQNFADYRDDSWVDPGVRQDYQEKLRLQAQKNQNATASVEEKMIALTLNTPYKFNDLFDMSIRKFNMSLTMVNDLIDYKITQLAVRCGFVSMPKNAPLDHWLFKRQKDMYGDSYRDVDSVASGTGVSAGAAGGILDNK